MHIRPVGVLAALARFDSILSREYAVTELWKASLR